MSSSCTSPGIAAGSWRPSRGSQDSGRWPGAAARPSTKWCASTSGTPGRAPSGPTSRSSSQRPRRSSRGRVLVDSDRATPKVVGGLPVNKSLYIAPDVKLGKDVKLAKFINLYGCEIGDETKIGTFVEIQKNA